MDRAFPRVSRAAARISSDKLASWSHSWESSIAGPSTPVIVETMRQPTDTGPWRAWDEEVLAVRTDGVESTIWRFAHTFNTYSGTTYSDAYYYLYIPRESQKISAAGRPRSKFSFGIT